MNTPLMFSSKTGKWDTPQSLIDDLAPLFHWDLDVCASRDNVCPNFYSEADNGLEQDWGSGLRWMNPPYGRHISEWVSLARLVSELDVVFGGATVCLLPARTDTRWWQDNVPFASQVVFIKGRLKFGDAKNSAPFPSAFVVFGEITTDQREELDKYGWNPRKSHQGGEPAQTNQVIL